MTVAIIDNRAGRPLIVGAGAQVAGALTGEARVARDNALAAKNASEDARDIALNAKDLAGAAALSIGRVYANTTAGLAATTNGQYFWTVNPANLYLNSSGVAVLKDEIATLARSLGAFSKSLVPDNLSLKATLDGIAEKLEAGDGLDFSGFQQPSSPVKRTAFEKVLDLPVDALDYETSEQLLDQERSARRKIELGASLEVLAAQLTLQLDAPFNNVGISICGRGWQLDTPSLSSGFNGSALTVPIINLNRPRPSAVNNNAVIRLQDFAVVGGSGPKTAGTGQHGISGSINGSIIDSLLVQYCGGHGLNLEHSYIAHVKGGLYFGNYGNGINILYAFNAGIIDQIRAYANGRAWTGDQGNIFAFGFGNSNYSPVIRDADVSYSGYVAWSMAAGTIESIVVSSNVATVTTSTPHGRSTGDKIGLRSATLAPSGTPSGLASIYGYTITVTGADTFTFPTSGVADGTYTVSNLPNAVIGPNSHGMLALGNEGMRIEGFYCEDPIGPALYLSQSKGVVITGGFILNGDVIIEAVTGVEIGAMKFQGESRLITGETSHRAEINVLSSNVFDSPARWVRSAYYMMDGRRYGPAIPSSGSWSVGEVLWNSNPAVGDPIGWMCTVSGSPGTWKPMGVTGTSFMSAVADPTGGATVDAEARTAIGQILTQLRSKNFMST